MITRPLISVGVIRGSRIPRCCAAGPDLSIDLHPSGLLEAAFLRSPVAHGLIRSNRRQRSTRAAGRACGLYAGRISVRC
jgi:hypothetical protein